MVLALVLVALAIVQVSLVDFLPTPWAVPDLVVVAVLAVAVARGPLIGGLVGAGAGLILDLIPPAAGPLGGWMLVLALAGAVMGRVAETYQPGPFTAMLLLAIGAGAVVVARAAVLWFAGWSVDVSVLGAAVASAAWALRPRPSRAIARDPFEQAGPADPGPTRVARGAGSAGGVGAS